MTVPVQTVKNSEHGKCKLSVEATKTKQNKAGGEINRLWIVILIPILVIAYLTFYFGSTTDKIQQENNSKQFGVNNANHEKAFPPHELIFKFLSPVNKTRLHHSHFHIIEVLNYEKNETYILHLKKSSGIFLVETVLRYHVEVDCVYSGRIVSSDGRYRGIASLSSCQHEIAFEGLVSLDGENFEIIPSIHSQLKSKGVEAPEHERIPRMTRQSKSKSGVKHVVKHKVNKAKASSGYRRKDSKRVPPELLRKAREQMLKDQENLEDETDDDDNDEDLLAPPNLRETSFGFDENLDLAGSSIESELEDTSFALRKRIIKKKPAGKNRPKVIELAIFTDEVFYRKWAEDYPNDTEKRISQYVLALVNNMNFLYAQSTLKPRVTFRLVQVRVSKSTPSGLRISPYGDQYLDDFCVYAGEEDKNGAFWDHAMMISGYDLLDSYGGPGNLGIAYTGTMCLRYYSCSLVEFVKGFVEHYGFGSKFRIGHSLGMLHDGEEFNSDCDESKYLMAALAGPGQAKWSDCSNKNLYNFFATGDSDPSAKNSKYVPRCLLKKGSKKKSVQYKKGKFPGQIFNTKGQCKTACDDCTPYVTSTSPYNNICWMLHCSSPLQGIIEVHPALEGTNCGNNKRCRAGKCV